MISANYIAKGYTDEINRDKSVETIVKHADYQQVETSPLAAAPIIFKDYSHDQPAQSLLGTSR